MRSWLVLVALAAVGCATSWLASEGQKERERERERAFAWLDERWSPREY